MALIATDKLEATLTNGKTIQGVVDYTAGTGHVRVAVRGLFGSALNTQTLMMNGKWTTWAQTNMSQAAIDEWTPLIKEAVRKAQKNCGGLSNGCKLPGWVGGDVTSSTTGSDLANELGANGGSGDDVNSDKLHINNFSTVTKDTIKALMPSGGSLNYPTDALYKRNNATGFNQDHVKIKLDNNSS